MASRNWPRSATRATYQLRDPLTRHAIPASQCGKAVLPSLGLQPLYVYVVQSHGLPSNQDKLPGFDAMSSTT